MFKRLLIVAGLLGLMYRLWPDPIAPVSAVGGAAPPGFAFSAELDVRRPPLQEEVDADVTLRVADYVLTPIAQFQVAGLVLAVKRYRTDREADLSPLDLALGWGPMADADIVERIDVSQGARFYRWRVEEFPLPRRDIERHSANMHLIPANAEVARRLDELGAARQVRFKGWLVNVEARDGWRWRSSLSRNDTGAGACELVLVDAFDVL